MEELTRNDLEKLITDRVTESLTLEYKGYEKSPDGFTNANKEKVLHEIAAMMNNQGGRIILGMEEDCGVPSRLSGLPISEHEEDKWIGDLRQCIRDRFDPSLNTFHIQIVRINEDRAAVVITIPRNDGHLHGIKLKMSGTKPRDPIEKQIKKLRDHSLSFPFRDNNGLSHMTVSDVERFVLKQARLRDDLDRFIMDRLHKIADDEAGFTMIPGPKIVLHIVSEDAPNQSGSVNSHPFDDSAFIPPVYRCKDQFGPKKKWVEPWKDQVGVRKGANLHGYAAWQSRPRSAMLSDIASPEEIEQNEYEDPWIVSYAQYLRSGALEAVVGYWDRISNTIPNWSEAKEDLAARSQEYGMALEEAGHTRPWYVSAALLGAKGFFAEDIPPACKRGLKTYGMAAANEIRSPIEVCGESDSITGTVKTVLNWLDVAFDIWPEDSVGFDSGDAKLHGDSVCERDFEDEV